MTGQLFLPLSTSRTGAARQNLLQGLPTAREFLRNLIRRSQSIQMVSDLRSRLSKMYGSMPGDPPRCGRPHDGLLYHPVRRTIARPDSANWNWWEQSGARSGDDASAKPAHGHAYESRSYP